jgi:hypothetical protein
MNLKWDGARCDSFDKFMDNNIEIKSNSKSEKLEIRVEHTGAESSRVVSVRQE